jgi:DNA topoisomerase-1
VTVEKAAELIGQQNAGDKIFGTDPATGLTVYGWTGRFGPYVQLGEQEDGSKEKPKRASLFKSMTLDELGLDDALKLLSLPRSVGTDDEGVEILALNGATALHPARNDRRSLESEDQLFALTVAEAIQRSPRPPGAGGRRTSTSESGQDPVSNHRHRPIGSFGPCTDGGQRLAAPSAHRDDLDPAPRSCFGRTGTGSVSNRIQRTVAAISAGGSTLCPVSRERRGWNL